MINNVSVLLNPIFIISAMLVIGLAFVNGKTDATNSIATCISTRAIKLKSAIMMGAICTFLGVLVMSLLSSKVASTMMNMVDFGDNNTNALIGLGCGLISAILWAVLAEKVGIPSSTSHSLIAGISGSAIAIKKDFSGINFDVWKNVLFGMAISLVLGFLLGFLLSKIVKTLFKHSDRRVVNKWFRKGQILSSSLLSFVDGAQDGQKFLGLFMLALSFSGTYTLADSDSSIPFIIILLFGLTMSLGVTKAGFKIIKTVGTKVSKLELYEGTCADFSSAICLLLSTLFGIPISSTHTKSASVMGVGASKRISNVNWNVAKNMLISWCVVFPCCGLIGFLLTNIALRL